MNAQTPLTARFPRRFGSMGALLLTVVMVASAYSAQPQRPSALRRTPRSTALKTVQLPEPVTNGAISLERALVEQQKLAVPSDQRLRFSEISQLAWAAQGARVPQAGSAAATMAAQPQQTPMKVYFILPDGVYLYNPVAHSLQQLSNTDDRREMATTLLNKPAAPIGGAQIVLAGSLRDFASQYSTPRARSMMLIQAGQTAQNIQLQAVALGLTYVSVEDVNINSVKRIIRLAKGIDPLYVMFVGYPASETTTTTEPATTAPQGKRVLLIVAQQGYQDQELFETKRGLELAGVSAPIASTRTGSIIGALGGTANAELLVNQVNLNDYSGIVLIGGPGAVDLLVNPTVLNLVRQAAAQRKVVAAIGTAPSVLANAGVLRGVRVTGFLTEQARIQQGGATYTGNPAEKDGLIVTATGPLAVTLFVQAILEGLNEIG